jgi:hypothetical protein
MLRIVRGHTGAVVHEKPQECLSEGPRNIVRFHHAMSMCHQTITIYHFPKPKSCRRHMEGLRYRSETYVEWLVPA